MSDFFQPPPPSFIVEPVPHEEWMGPGWGELPSVVPIEKVLARTSEVVIYVSDFAVYPVGFEFEVQVVARDKESGLDPFGIDHRLNSQKTGEISPELLRLGFEFSDGSKVTNTGAWARPETETLHGRPESPVMDQTGGSWSEGTWDQGFWVWPLPPTGSFALVCEWPAADIPLTRTVIDSAPVRDAAARATKPFPDLP